jgi:hypothetical protein
MIFGWLGYSKADALVYEGISALTLTQPEIFGVQTSKVEEISLCGCVYLEMHALSCHLPCPCKNMKY